MIYLSSQSRSITRLINKQLVQSLWTMESLTRVIVSHIVNANFQLNCGGSNWIPITEDKKQYPHFIINTDNYKLLHMLFRWS